MPAPWLLTYLRTVCSVKPSFRSLATFVLPTIRYVRFHIVYRFLFLARLYFVICLCCPFCSCCVQVSYNTAISACDRLRDADAAVRLLRQARENDIVPDVVSYNSVISALGHNSLWQVRKTAMH